MYVKSFKKLFGVENNRFFFVKMIFSKSIFGVDTAVVVNDER